MGVWWAGCALDQASPTVMCVQPPGDPVNMQILVLQARGVPSPSLVNSQVMWTLLGTVPETIGEHPGLRCHICPSACSCSLIAALSWDCRQTGWLLLRPTFYQGSGSEALPPTEGHSCCSSPLFFAPSIFLPYWPTLISMQPCSDHSCNKSCALTRHSPCSVSLQHSSTEGPIFMGSSPPV